MNRFLLLIALVLLTHISWCQNNYPYQDIKLEKPADYKATEPVALSAATFLLITPFNEVDASRAAALQFLVKWMSGSKDQNFFMQGKVTELAGDPNLLSLYIAAMAKYSLENKAEAVHVLTVELNASRLLLAYCDDPKNNFKLKKRSRKILETN
ncbi:MAG: hypothetical protein ABIO79_02930 [Ferruginibacter sp.]